MIDNAPIEFVVASRKYRATKIDGWTQFDLFKRLLPVLIPLIGLKSAMNAARSVALNLESVVLTAGAEASEAGTPEESKSSDEIMAALDTGAKALAALSDDDSRFIMSKCFEVCDRQSDSGGWFPLWNKSANRLQFNDLNMAEMLGVTSAVLKWSLASFLPELASVLKEAGLS